MNRFRVTLSSGENIVPLCIDLQIARLRSIDGAERKKAREVLGRIGKSAVPYILPMLKHPHEIVRWEACKTLERIRDVSTAGALAEMLMDDNMDVRWVAAAALIELEHHAIEPLLVKIEEHFDSVILREGAHHVLHSLKEMQLLDERTEEVYHALKVNELPSKAAFAAIRALDHLRSDERRQQYRWTV